MTEYFSSPTELKKLRACADCHLVKTFEQFRKEGCENCNVKGNEMVEKLTKNFNGIIAITNPKKSWAARYLGKGKNKIFIYYIDKLIPGFYCLNCSEDKRDNDEYERDDEEEED